MKGSQLLHAADATIAWRRSTYCADGTCVEVAQVGDQYLLRDSKDPDRPYLAFERSDWLGFIDGIKHDEFRI